MELRAPNKRHKILLLWTVLFSVFENILCADTTGNCSISYPPEQFLVYGVKDGTVIPCRLFSTEACVNGMLPPHLNGSDVGTPRDLKVSGKLIPNHGHLSSQVSVQWKVPNILITLLKGFLFEIREYNITNGNNDSKLFCRIFDMSQMTFTDDDTEISFKKKMVRFRGGKNYFYRLDVFSLPMSPSSQPLTQFFSVQAYIRKDDISAERWSTFVSYDSLNLTAPATLSVTFSLERAMFNFSRYHVVLVSDRDPNNPADTCSVSTFTEYTCFNQTFPPPPSSQNHVTVSFPGVEEGSYYLQIRPVDGAVCPPCLTTNTPNFVVNAPPEVPTSSQLTLSDPGPEREKYLFVGVGCGLGLLLLALMLVGLRWKTVSGRKRSSPITEIRNNNPFKNENGKSIFLLCAKDNEFHKETVEKFALYLSNYHRYTVHHLAWKTEVKTLDEKCTWMKGTMDTVDFIVVVNSKSAFYAFKSSSTDSISFGLSYLRSKCCDENFFRKIIFLTFEYTEDKFCIKDLNPNAQYRIPNQLKGLLLFLGGNKYIGKEMACTEGLDTSQEGIALREAIRKCRAKKRMLANDDKEPHLEARFEPFRSFSPSEPSEVQSASLEIIENGILNITNEYEAGTDFNHLFPPDPSEVRSVSTEGIQMSFVDIDRRYEDSKNYVMDCSDNNVTLQYPSAQPPNKLQGFNHPDIGTRAPVTSVEVPQVRGADLSDKASAWSSPSCPSDISQTTAQLEARLHAVNKLYSTIADEIPEQMDGELCSNETTKTIGYLNQTEHHSKRKKSATGAYVNPAFSDDHCHYRFQPPSEIDSDILTDDINKELDIINVNSGAYTRM